MRIALCVLLVCVGGCSVADLLEGRRPGFRFELDQPPVVMMRTPLLLDRETGGLEPLAPSGGLSFSRERSHTRTRGLTELVAPAPAALGIPAPVAIPALPVQAPGIVAAPIATAAPTPPPVVREERFPDPCLLREILSRLQVIESRLPPAK